MSTSLHDVRTMSYPDFVAFVGQRNTPPGATVTLDAWIRGADITARSRVLDVACSTGFSSRVAALATGCRAKGFDISRPAVRVARREAAAAKLSSRVDYFVGDVSELAFAPGQFTHALAGCCFGFFTDRERALDQVANVLAPRGYLCAANFYMTRRPPASLRAEVERAVGFSPAPVVGWNRWRRLFERRFELHALGHRDLAVVGEDELERAVRESVIEGCRRRRVPAALHAACVDRMVKTRRVLNRMRAYQAHSVEIWRLPS